MRWRILGRKYLRTRRLQIEGFRLLLPMMIMFSAVVVWRQNRLTFTLEDVRHRWRSTYRHILSHLGLYEPLAPRNTGLWVVLDALTSPCDDVTSLTSQENWTVVIVTHAKNNVTGCHEPNCLQLTWQDCLKELGDSATFRSLRRPSKLFGYLLAMKKGADAILDADCNTDVENVSSEFFASESDESGLLYDGSKLFNPFHHWGYQDAYPQQFFDLTNQRWRYMLNSDKYYVVDTNNVWIRQGVTLSESTCYKRIDAVQGTRGSIPQGSPVFIGPKAVSPTSTGPTLFRRDAFFWLFLPPGVASRLSALFRSLWLTKANRHVGVTLGYYFLRPPKRSEFGDIIEDCGNYNGNASVNSLALFKCLNEKSCLTEQSAYSCSIDMATDIFRCLLSKTFSENDMKHLSKILTSWKYDVIDELGISEKAILKPAKKKTVKLRYGIPYQSVRVNKFFKENFSETVVKGMESFCHRNISSLDIMARWISPVINDILLIIVVNYVKLFPTLPYMEYIHRQYFQHIVYCGPSVDNFTRYADSLGLTYVTYITLRYHDWRFMYECVTTAMKLRLPVRGYLQIGEDVLLNSWNLVKQPRDKIWFHRWYKPIYMHKDTNNYSWTHWNSSYGHKAVLRVFSTLHNASASLGAENQTTGQPASRTSRFQRFARRFLNNYASNLDPDHIIISGTDFFYIPEVLREDYIFASELFRDNDVMTEIAVPVMHAGLTRFENINYIYGKSLWGIDRDKPWRHFNASDLFIHPIKLLMLAYVTDGFEFFCQKYVRLYENRTNINRGLQ